MQLSGISFDSFKIIKISFSVNKKYKDDKDILIAPEIAIAPEYVKTEKILKNRLRVSLNTGNIPFFFDLVGEGKFLFKKKPTDKIVEQFSYINCPAIIFPYIRETIADITRRAGFPPLHLPPINFVELAKELKDKKK